MFFQSFYTTVIEHFVALTQLLFRMVLELWLSAMWVSLKNKLMKINCKLCVEFEQSLKLFFALCRRFECWEEPARGTATGDAQGPQETETWRTLSTVSLLAREPGHCCCESVLGCLHCQLKLHLSMLLLLFQWGSAAISASAVILMRKNSHVVGI